MASKEEFVAYIANQLEKAGHITYRKMFGEYGMYCDGKIFALICENQLFVKVTKAGEQLSPDLELMPPYKGAKPYFLMEDIDNKEYLTKFVKATCEELPVPKPKVKKVKEETKEENKKAKTSKGSFDYKKEYKEFYMPKNKPEIVEVPTMNYLAVRGKGDPNKEGGEYKLSIELLYGIAFTIKMSKKGNHQIEGYFDYVVPPLEGLWWQNGQAGMDMDYNRKEDLNFISLIRLPDFVTEEDFKWAIQEAEKKKNRDYSKVEYLTYREGLCVQCMHIGAYDNEPATIERMQQYIDEMGYGLDISKERFHHEIYLSDARRTAPERLKTVIRHPILKI